MGFAIVIPSKTASNLRPCIAALHKHEPDANIAVIDDGIDWVGGEWDESRDALYAGIKPFIYARNCNLGIATAEENDVVLLNDDAVLTTAGGFTLLQQAAIEHPEYGVIASTCNNVGNTNQHPKGIGLREDPRMVCFVCVFIPRTTIKTVGLLDERFVGYGLDDDDYCLRVRNAGLKIGIHDGCYVDHGSLRSTFRGGPGDGGNYLPNLQLFIEKWGHDNWGVRSL